MACRPASEGACTSMVWVACEGPSRRGHGRKGLGNDPPGSGSQDNEDVPGPKTPERHGLPRQQQYGSPLTTTVPTKAPPASPTPVAPLFEPAIPGQESGKGVKRCHVLDVSQLRFLKKLK